ncbi:Nucleoside triphosphate pyrophosphohydrolase MazG, partial [hydrothermal vent metagenome]
SLLKALRVQERVSRVGFDWEKAEDVIKKVESEFDEFKSALKERDERKIEEEFGDILFTLVNLSRFVGLNPEEALRKTISRFISRFSYIETSAKQEGRALADYTLEEMDHLWEEAKRAEKHS